MPTGLDQLKERRIRRASPACSAEAISRRRHHVAAAPTATPMALAAIHAHQVGLCRSRPAASKGRPTHRVDLPEPDGPMDGGEGTVLAAGAQMAKEPRACGELVPDVV